MPGKDPGTALEAQPEYHRPVQILMKKGSNLAEFLLKKR